MKPLLRIALLACTLTSASAQTMRFTNTPVRAVLTLNDKESAVVLAGRTETDLFYSMAGMPTGVYASVKLPAVQNARMEASFDEAALDVLVANRRWLEAGRLLMRAAAPAMPYLDLPGNETIEYATRASMFLLQAATEDAPWDIAATPAARPALAAVFQLSSAIQNAAWYYGAEAGRLRAAQALARLGRPGEAEARMEDAAVPDPGDADFGLYWYTRAVLAKGRGDAREAANAAARSLAFDNKNPETFIPALALLARCCEELGEWHRARDVYYETARLFRGTRQGEAARERLAAILRENRASGTEAVDLARLFFGTEEDMDKLAREFLGQEETEPAGRATSP